MTRTKRKPAPARHEIVQLAVMARCSCGATYYGADELGATGQLVAHLDAVIAGEGHVVGPGIALPAGEALARGRGESS